MTLTLNDKMRLTGGIIGGLIGSGIAIGTFATLLNCKNEIIEAADDAVLIRAEDAMLEQGTNEAPPNAQTINELTGRISASTKKVIDAGVIDFVGKVK